MSLKDICPVIQFKDLGDERGKLVVIEGAQNIPFEIKRVFYIYGSDSSVVRGQHANRDSEFVLINVAGTSKVRITDGNETYIVVLNKPMMGVYIPKLIWKDMFDFSSDSVLLVLASTHYNGSEYIRDYNEYISSVGLLNKESELKHNSSSDPFNVAKISSPVISLCMPTNGVLDWVLPSLDSIYKQGIEESLFEVVIMDNGDNYDFYKTIKEYQKNHDNLKYFKTDKTLFLSEPECYKAAKGELLKFVNHRFILKSGTIQYLLDFVQKYRKTKPVIYFSNGVTSQKNDVLSYKKFGEFVCALECFSTWSGGMTVWKSDLDEMRDFTDYNYLFPHTDILFQRKNAVEYIVDGTLLWDELPQEQKPKGKYNVFYAFGVEFMYILLDLLRKKYITIHEFLKVKKNILYFLCVLFEQYIVRRKYCCYELTDYDKFLKIFFSKKEIYFQMVVVLKDSLLFKLRNFLKK